MFEIFVAMFGGLYHGIRYGHDKRKASAASQETERVVNNHLNTVSSWKQRVVDTKMELELREMLQRSFKTEIAKTLRQLGWNDDFGFSTDTDRENVLRILMASKGKLPRRDAELGIPSWHHGVPDTIEQVSRNRESFKLIQFIDSLLRQNGINEQMYIHRYCDLYNPLNYFSSHIGGNYVWAPMLCFHPRIVSVK